MSSDNPAPLYGLLLVGGKSSRMGVDKATLVYQKSLPEWKRLHGLLTQSCEEVFLCHREDQDFGVPCIIDPADGPLRAIHTAQIAHPNAAWLVIACDMPLLTISTLDNLISERDSDRNATCYLSPVDQLPEPLCAIYEPSINSEIHHGLSNGIYCPRKHLTDAHFIISTQPSELMNANSPADQLEIRDRLEGNQISKTIEVTYFAKLKDLANCDEESIKTSSSTASGIYEELKAKYHFPYKQKDLMLAINDDFSPWETPIKERDKIVFIPPVAGG
ncbi:NTP transferase domain-containing protein [Akkermansiaceae bacterium]|nr:NTP transferase domain-containing protein [Akkermansiaceae bacterium]